MRGSETRVHDGWVESTPTVVIRSGPGGVGSRAVRSALRDASEAGLERVTWAGGVLGRDDWYELMAEAMELGMTNDLETGASELSNPCIALRVVEMTDGGMVRLLGSEEGSHAFRACLMLVECGKSEDDIVLLSEERPWGRVTIDEMGEIRYSGRVIGSVERGLGDALRGMGLCPIVGIRDTMGVVGDR